MKWTLFTKGPHGAWLKFSGTAFVLTAFLGAAYSYVSRASRPSTLAGAKENSGDPALENLKRLLKEKHGLQVAERDNRSEIYWHDFKFSDYRFADFFRSHWVSFAAAKGPRALMDIFRLRVRVNSRGIPFRISKFINLTRTEHSDERNLTVQGEFLAYINRIDQQNRQVHILDYRGENPIATKGHSFLGKLMNSINNYQKVGRFKGLNRMVFEFVKVPKRVNLKWRGGPGALRLEVSYSLDGKKPLLKVLLDPENGAMSGSGKRGLNYLPTGTKGKWMLADFVANTIRNTIGVKRFEWVKAYILTLQDNLRKLRYKLFGPSKAERVAEESGRKVEKSSTSQIVSFKNHPPPGYDPFWPPPALKPFIAKPKLKNEGQWFDVYPFDLKNPGAPPAMLKAILRPDPQRPFAQVRLLLMDPRQVGLNIVAGTHHPRSTTGNRGSGRIPRKKEILSRILGAFNGGFKTMHGSYGMMERGREIIKPKADAATVVVYKDGRIGFGDWKMPKGKRYPGILSYRQNLPPLIRDGVINPTQKRRWGFVPKTYQDKTYTFRSALGMTRHGHLLYVWGDSLSAVTMARAMVRAGCVYALHMDMNWGHSRCEFYRVYDKNTLRFALKKKRIYRLDGMKYQAQRLSPKMIPWLFPRYLKVDLRDFIYMTLRRAFPYDEPAGTKWTSKGLPEYYRTFPLLLARTTLELESRGSVQSVQVFKFNRKVATPHLRLDINAPVLSPLARRIPKKDLPQLLVTVGLGPSVCQGASRGIWIDHKALFPTQRGAMTLTIDRSGELKLGRWGDDIRRNQKLRYLIQGPALLDRGRLALENAEPLEKGRMMTALGIDKRGDLLLAAAETQHADLLGKALQRLQADKAILLPTNGLKPLLLLYSPTDGKGIQVTNIFKGTKIDTKSIEVGHDQCFLYLLPRKVPPRVLHLNRPKRKTEQPAPR